MRISGHFVLVKLATKLTCKIPNDKSQISNKSQLFRFKYPNDLIRSGNYWTQRELSVVGLRRSKLTLCYWKLKATNSCRIIDPQSRFPFLCVNGFRSLDIGIWDLFVIWCLLFVICPRIQLQFHIRSNWALFGPEAGLNTDTWNLNTVHSCETSIKKIILPLRHQGTKKRL